MLKNALITGAGRGIGKAIALALVKADFQTLLVARTMEEIENVSHEIEALGKKAIALPCDITDERSLLELAEKVSAIGPISLLVNNAGIAPSAKIENTT